MKRLTTGLAVLAASLLFAGTGATEEMTTADLSGTYYAIEAIDEDGFNTVFLEMTFDGQGTVEYTETFASTSQTASGSASYAVSADGKLSIENGTLVGAVSPSGNYVMFSDMTKTDEGGQAFLIVGIKASSDLTVADAEGNFPLLMYGRDTDGIYSGTESVTLDGQGSFTSDGPSGTYTVDSTGKIQLIPDGQEGEAYEINGILSADGTVFIGVDTDNSDSDIFIFGGIKAGNNLTITDIAGRYYVNEFGFYWELGYEAYFSEVTIEPTGTYASKELLTTCECSLRTSDGTIDADGNNAFSLAEDGEDGSVTAGFSLDGELFAFSDVTGAYGFLGIGIVQADVANGVDLSDDSGGGGGSDGGCFIHSLTR